jgi:hypothetical protein
MLNSNIISLKFNFDFTKLSTSNSTIHELNASHLKISIVIQLPQQWAKEPKINMLESLME